MAEFVVAAVARSLADLLIGNVLKGQIISILGVRQNIDDIKNKLMQIKLVLKDAENKPDNNIQIWVSNLREIAYDAEDVIRTFSIKIATRISGPAVKRYAWYSVHLRYLWKVSFKIKAIKATISECYEFATKSELISVGEDSSSSAFDRTQYSHENEDIVGLKRNIEDLAADLVDDGRHGSVVSICGMAGIGKTTLARQLYHNDDIRRYFDCFGWASISHKCNPEDAWKAILFNLVSPSKEERENIKGLNKDELVKKLYQVQKEKKCLVILDDIWEEKDWQNLRHAFPTGGEGRSRMLLTTRYQELASSDRGGRPPHVLKFLTEKEGWELFRRKAFPGVKNNPDLTVCEVKENLGREIVKKCEGLPLAIVVFGGLLATKDEVHEWERMNHYKLKQPKGHEDHRERILWQVMALSYDELPHGLKPCFLYFSHFPEDAAIPRKKLIQLWIAEGIVSQDEQENEQENEQVLEDLAEDYLVYLVNRCMVQVGDFGSTRRIKTCRLHDMMRDFCLEKAKQQNFLKVIHYPNEIDDASQGKTRRLAIYLPADVDRPIFSRHKEYSNLRSLLYFHGKRCRVTDWHLIEQILNLKMLRVLDLEGVKGPYGGELPREIGHLIQLQFLSLKKTEFRILPSSMGNLIFLKTLNLQTISKFGRDSTVQIPNVIWKMKRLTHLYLPKWCGNMVDKLRLSNLNRLQTLVNFPANKCDASDLLKLTNLRKLVLNDPEHFQSLVEIFNPPNDTLSRLQSLSLKSETLQFPDKVIDVRQLLSSCSGLQKLHVEGRIETLPELGQLPKNLAKLTLWGSNLVEDPIPTLEKLPNLRILSGWTMFVGKKMVFSNQGFPKLKSLLLRGLPDFEDWMMEEGAMPNLYRLEISNCNKLKTIPHAVKSVSTLQELEICGCLFKIKIKPGGEDYYKVQHVPSIVIRN